MDSKSLLTTAYRLDSAERFIDQVEDNQFYFFVANHLNPNNIVQPIDNPRSTTLDTYYGMIFGKRIYANDTQLMVKRYDYEANTIYAMYDHSANNLYDSNFYVVVEDGAQYDVFKCLDNNNGSPSTVTPDRSNVSEDNDDFYYPTDGYRWKYMYSINSTTANKFATEQFFPVNVDLGVRSKAVSGSIDVITVDNPGKGYSNYISGSFGLGDIRLNGNPLVYGISAPGVKTANGFYDACWLYIATGPGSGQFRQISSYVANTTTNFVTLTEPFDPSDLPENTSTYEIYPSVNINGDGRSIVEAAARAIIDPNGNTVSHIEMLSRGRNYNTASAVVMYSGSVGVTEQSEVRVIYSPDNGHGYDAPLELGSHYVALGLKLTGSESNTVLQDNDYSQLGILKNPQFNKVTLDLVDLNQQFSTTEMVYKIDPVQLSGTFSTKVDANTEITNEMVSEDVDPSKSIKIGDQLIFSSSNSYFCANVISVSNTSIFLDQDAKIDTEGSYTANVYYMNPSHGGFIDSYFTDQIVLTDSDSGFSIGDTIFAVDSGTIGKIDSIKISDVDKSFTTYIQCSSYLGDMAQGTFVPDEEVYQTSLSAGSARFHSSTLDPISGKTKFYFTHQLGTFNTGADDPDLTNQIVGVSSGAIAELTNKYLPDLVFGSGEVFYIENFTPITREDLVTETFKMVLDF